MSEWTVYTGSDEQIAEIINSKNGFIVDSQWSVFNEPNKLQIDFDDKTNIDWLKGNFEDYDVTKYWIIPDDPLREMKIRQAMTGQPVWVRDYKDTLLAGEHNYDEYVTTTPDWNIPTAKYSFTAFVDTSK